MRKFLPELRAFVRLNAGRLVRARESSSDLVQSVCREVVQNAGRFRYEDEAGFRKWVFTAALHKIQDRRKYWRARKRDALREALANEAPFGAEGEEEIVARYRTICTPSRSAVSKETMARIEAAFDRLPDDYREIITLARLAGLSHDEIARRRGSTPESSRQLLARALARLAIFVSEEERGN